jgi:predicted lipoprotein with Yx(FWY)xxD motif
MRTLSSVMFTLALASAPLLCNAQVMVDDGKLVGPTGMTLYTFDRDVAGSDKSTCNGPCATNWPPMLAGEKAPTGDGYSAIEREDGKRQIAYKGKPLYYWSKDVKPGDKSGDGFNQAWHVAKP